MNRSQLKAGTLYYFQESKCYFYTPDGTGGYWYDTGDEVVEAGFGDFPITYRERLTDW